MHTMKPPSCWRPQPPPATPTRSSHSSSRAKVVHLATPILPSCNYCGNPAHKASECNILFEDFFCVIVGKRDIEKIVCFAKFSKRKQFRLPRQNLLAFFAALNQKPRHLNLPFRFSPPRVIPVRMLRRRSTMLVRGRCFKPMLFKFKLCKMNSNR
jgi:hypothetical protein